MSTDVSEVRAASIIRAIMMEVACTSETSVDIQLKTRQYIPEDSELHTRRRENLKPHTYVDIRASLHRFKLIVFVYLHRVGRSGQVTYF
jgi:hypothetical protein